jgi:uridine kinase
VAERPKDPGATQAALAESPLLARLDDAERARLVAALELRDFPQKTRIHGDGDAGKHLYFVLSGSATLRRGELPLRRIGPGDSFGELALLGGRHRGEIVTSEAPLRAAALSAESWLRLEREEPRLAVKVASGVASALAEEIANLTGDVGLLLRGRSLPRARELVVRIGGEERRVATGTRLVDLLPVEVDGALVVAGLLGQKPVSLSTAVTAEAEIAPLTVRHWEGRAIYAHSLGLLLLEAAHQVAPGLRVRLGPSRGTHQEVELEGAQGQPDEAAPERAGGSGGPSGAPPSHDLAERIGAAMRKLAQADHPFRAEFWATDEAQKWFQERGWDDAFRLLRIRRQATVRLVSCGEVYALSMGPLLPGTGRLAGFRLVPREGGGLALELGKVDPRSNGAASAAWAAPRARAGTDMAEDHLRWLRAMDVTSVGAFNELCINGQVSQLIRVAEGFQEKRIGQIADAIAAARDRIRIISIAGPSSSGKTTFIKRLTVQLQIDGVNPVGLSLDDYYVDREKTPRAPSGDWDFEALEALDLALLQDHVGRLLAGETVTTARYDFLSGLSHPGGGATIQLRPGDVLLLEGIHGLNPRLLGAIPRAGALHRIFIHPATTLPFDRLTRVSATDLRLLRRIVRDRHQRGYSAAENILRWASVQAGEREHIYPFQGEADEVFDTSLIYEPAVLKVFAERYLLEVPQDHPAYPTAHRLRYLVDRFVSIYPDHVPPTSLVREFIGGSGFEY